MSAKKSAAREPLTRDTLKTREGHARAMRGLMLADHGIIRTLYDNSHEIAPGAYRSFQPSPAKLAQWKEKGIRTIVNLRGPAPSPALLLEEEACEKLGLRLENFRVYSREAPTPEILRGARDLFDRIEYPAVFHCKSGADRVGVMATLYLFFRAKRPLDEALRQLSLRYGHIRAGKTGVIDKAFELYLDHARANDIALDDVGAFFDFVQSDAYDPVAIKRDYMGAWWGNFLTERLLKRE